MKWWWCLEHARDEEGRGCVNMNRMGPYDSAEQAAGALDRARERTAARDAEDAAEDDWGR